MSTLYDRKVYVVIGPSRQLNVSESVFVTSGISLLGGGSILTPNQMGFPFINIEPQIEDSKGFADLRVSFSITKDLEKVENKATVSIFNVNEDSYKMLQKINETYYISVCVGYGDDSKSQIFYGNIEKSAFTRDRSDWILTIDSKDGQDIIQNSIINKSYRENMTVKDILLDMINSSSESTKDVFSNAKKWIIEKLSTSNKKTNNGLSISGKLLDEANKLLSELGATLSIQDGKAQVIFVDGNNKTDIILLSPSSGLIGSPINKGADEGIEFKCLLIPLINPGGLVKIESRYIADYFRVDRVQFKGDTHSSDWECMCEAVKPDNIDRNLQEIKYYDNVVIEEGIGSTWKMFL